MFVLFIPRYAHQGSWSECRSGLPFPVQRFATDASEIRSMEAIMKLMNLKSLLIVPALLAGFACTNQTKVSDMSYKDGVQKALEQADLKDVSVSEDRDKNTITLSGTLHSDEAKNKAADVAKTAAGERVVANEISVQPVGIESQAKDVASNLDDGIESNYKASLIAHSLDKQHIKFDAKNGVLTLKGNVKTVPERNQAQELAQAVPNVQQVLNQIEVRR
jgi:osmotically-inducible protein OsmY